MSKIHHERPEGKYDNIDPKILALAVALAEVVRSSAPSNESAVERDDAPRPLTHWADVFGVKLFTLNEAAKSGRLAATFPAGKSRGRVATRAAIVAFLQAKPAARPQSATVDGDGDEYLQLVGGAK